MVQKYYFDTAIWRDLYENRTDNYRPLGEWAFELIVRIREQDEIILFSDLVEDELSKDFSKIEIRKLFNMVSDEQLLEKVDIQKDHIKEAALLSRNYRRIPFGDCLHAVLAHKNNAILVTRDHHFDELYLFVKVRKPEDLI